MGFPPVFEARGFKVFDPGRFLINITDFSAQISAFKKANAEILFGNMPMPIFSNFWSPGGAAGLQAEDWHHRQGAPVAVGRRFAGPAREESDTRGMVVTQSSLQIQSHGADCAAILRRSTKRSPRGNGRRRSVSAMPCSRWRSTFSSGRRTRIRRRRLSRRSAPPRLNTIVGPVQWQGPPPNQWTKISRQECLHHAARGRTVGAGKEMAVRTGHNGQPEHIL